MLGAVAEFDKSVLVAKLKAVRIRKRKATGRCEGRKPFGMKPGEGETLALIRRLRRKLRGGARLSYDAIAARLNADGVPTRTGKLWAGPTVYGILKRFPAPNAINWERRCT